jgi:hypothetical protein
MKTKNGMSMSDNYIYTPSTTDITIRWRKRGWIPPTEDLQYQKKWADFRISCAQGIESLGRAAPQFNPSVVKWKMK